MAAAGRPRGANRWTRARSPAPSPQSVAGVSYHPQLCAPHPRRCCAPVILAEKTCVEPVLARVVQVLVEIDQFVLHTCACMRAGAGERVATWVHFGAQYAPRPRASSSVSSVAAGSDSVGAGTLALLRTGTSRRLSSVGRMLAPSTCSPGAASKWNRRGGGAEQAAPRTSSTVACLHCARIFSAMVLPNGPSSMSSHSSFAW